MVKTSIAVPRPSPLCSDAGILLCICTGEKGGVGKSTVAGILATEACARGAALVAVDGDVETPDFFNRFSNIDGVVAGKLDLTGDSRAALTRLGNWLEDWGASTNQAGVVIINTPASSEQIFGKFADLIGDFSVALGADLAISYSVGPGVEAVHAVERSVEGGLLSLHSARRLIVYGEHLGDSRAWPLRSSPVLARATGAGVETAALEALPEPVMARLRALRGPYSLAADREGGLKIIERSWVVRWLAGCRPISKFVLGPPMEQLNDE